VATDGMDAGLGTGLAHVEGIMEYLAVIEPEGGGSLRSALDAAARMPEGGALVAIFGRLTSFETDGIAKLASSTSKVIIVVTEPPVPPASARRNMTVVDASSDGRFATSWSKGVQA
jgi:hypothetical protein